ncbi:YggT family protein [Ferribacterium limneticum]|uniref:YggT family protein n=1 Tax=Ferribacterium limneticum TaxID=76259 RepID=UPI001CFC30F3|nr:YggT family protein [Ferribacterium limneticum]UCV18706.1 YggT family protein [Ferribacterium limneticum]
MQAIVFLLDAVVSFFCTLFLLRFMMQAMRVSFAGQIGDFVVKLTNWAVKPLRRIIPGAGGFDWASLVAALALQLLFTGIIVGASSSFGEVDVAALAPMILLHAARALLRLAVYILIGALILQAVLSWVNPYSPLSAPAHQLTRPLLDPIRRIVPLISGIDLSPLVAILLLQALLMFL